MLAQRSGPARSRSGTPTVWGRRHRFGHALARFLLLSLGLGACASPPSPSLLVISLDTTRRDHLSLYGYPRPTSPYIDLLAAGGIRFETAIAQMTITNPSHASMFTGLYPHTHKVGENTRRLPAERTTLAELLSAVGYRTAAFVSGYPLKVGITGIDQGFEVYDSDFGGRRRRGGEATVERALDWLNGLAQGERFFLFVHLYDAHGPYRPPERLLARFESEERGPILSYIPTYQRLSDGSDKTLDRAADYIDRYDALIAYQDELCGRLFAAVDSERTVVVVVADHGETLVERAEALNLNHGTSLFEEQVAIPLVLAAPGLRPASYPAPVETVDLLPTLLDLLGAPRPPELEVEGESLTADLIAGRPPSVPALAFSSNRAKTAQHADRGYALRDGEFLHAVRTRRWKLILYPGQEQDYVELYDLAADPAETTNVAAQNPQLADRLQQALAAWQREQPPTEEAPGLDPADREALRALGYLD